MKNRIALIYLIASGLAAVAPQAVSAEAQADETPTRMTREQWQNMTPEEREARMKALREQRAATSGAERQKLREELRALPPAEREAKFKEWEAKQNLPALSPEMQKRREEWLKLSPEERRAKIEELRKNRPASPPVDEKTREQRRAALEKKLAELRAQKAEGKLSPENEKRLQSLERAEKIMQAHPPTHSSDVKPAEKD